MNDYCSPSIHKRYSYTCFTTPELVDIAKSFNNYIIKKKLCKNSKCIISNQIDIEHKSKKELWNSIYETMKPLCNSEVCWIDQPFLKSLDDTILLKKLRFFTFKPKMTKTRYTWLDTNDINFVLNQYTKIYPKFEFLGALPSDFYKFTTIKRDFLNATKYDISALVFNTDDSSESGQHWLAFLIDHKNKSIEYFDSVGDLPNRNIKIWMKYIKKQLPDYTTIINRIQMQKKNTECGMFAINFIISRLKGKLFNEIKFDDNEMNKTRDIIFRPRKL